jgi:signal transduction histidine kinase
MLMFRSLRNKLLTLTITLSLIPLVGISAFSYFIGSRQIAEDRIKLSLEKMAQDTADKIDVMLREKKEEIYSMATTFPLIYPVMDDRHQGSMIQLLNEYCFNHDVYDLLLVADKHGKILAINTVDRNKERLPPDRISSILGSDIGEYPEENRLYSESIAGVSSQHDWYSSKLVRKLYDYSKEDSSRQFNVALSGPIINPNSHETMGVWINIINWSNFQFILDNVEKDLESLNLKTGYAFMFARDANSIIAHKYRANRQYEGSSGVRRETRQNLYQTKLIEDHGLKNLHDAILRKDRTFAYEFPKGNSKISGIAPIDDTSFGWILGVGIDGADIFRPIESMKWWLIGVTLLLSSLVVFFTYLIAKGITVPLENLIRTAQTIAQGNLSQRVEIRSADEIGILGTTFNDMARALSAREEELQELNKHLEDMVRQRTKELENSHEALKKAYLDLQSAQDQLVQTEKMASLGQLVAGIAHEIKNPLNFIYGNTGFLSDYTQKLQRLLEAYEGLASLNAEDLARIEGLKKEVNYDFIREDLRILIDNFTEGARRINTIVSDLRTFSRMDADAVSEIDLHAALDMSLNLLRNQYKNRVEIHRDYGEIPKIQGYSGKLSQVFMNLLSNAFHAIQGKGDVWIRTRSDNGAVEVEIEDNGVGIPKENIKRIFEPFFTTKGVGQGTGLGLSISYGIIEQHQGNIHVSSAPQRGSVFTVHLPVLQDRS